VVLKDGTLLICFLGDPSAGTPTVPRVAVWHEEGFVESVALSMAPGRMIGYLALPREASFSALGVRGTADRVAAALASPLPRRSASQLRVALGYSKTHEWRVRQQLHAELSVQGLGEHLHRQRGRIGLDDATTDVAVVVEATRLEEWERAALVLRAVGGGGLDRVGWLVTAGWPDVARSVVTDALREAVAWLGNQRLALNPSPTTTNARSTGATEAPALAPSTDLTLVRGAGPAQWVPRAADHARYRRQRLRRAAITALALCAVSAASLAWLSRSSPQWADVAGGWPTSLPPNAALMANLTKGLPLSNGIAASSGDVLLLRVRLPAEVVRAAAAKPLRLGVYLGAVSTDRLEYVVAPSGNTPPEWQDTVWVATQEGNYRLRAIPSTTQLVASNGLVVRKLKDLAPSGTVPVGHLVTGRVYFVDARFQVVGVNSLSPGAISSGSSVTCGPSDHPVSSMVRVLSGSIVTCTAHLISLGPQIVPAVTVYIGTTTWPPTSSISPTFGLLVWTRSVGAEPAETSFAEPLEVVGGAQRAIQYIPHSSELLDANGIAESQQFVENPQQTGVSIGPIGPGAENSLFFRFKVRVR
jgi:hypothetical protein